MKLRSVSPPQNHAVMEFVGDRAPLASGYGPENFHCACCGDLLLARMSASDISGAVFRCPTCETYNALEPQSN